MRIWIVNHYLTPPTRGGNTRHHHLAKELASLGHQVLLIGASHHHLSFQGPGSGIGGAICEWVDGVQYFWIRTPTSGSHQWSRFLSMLSFALSGHLLLVRRAPLRPDVVIGSTPHPFGAFIAERAAHSYSVPFVYEIRDLWPLTVQELGKYSPKHPVLRVMARLNRRLMDRADLIVSLLSGAGDYFLKEGLPERRTVYVPNGVDLELASSHRIRPPRNTRLVVTYAGNHGLANGLDSIVDCARVMAQHGFEDAFLFRLIGQGSHKAKLQAKALGLKNIRFEDAVPKTRIFRDLVQSDILIATLRKANLYKYGMSLNKVFDYLAAGRPIVFGGESPHNPIRLAKAGILVPPEDSVAMMEALLRIRDLSDSEREQMGRRGREFAFANCSFAQRARELEKALVQVVEESPSSESSSRVTRQPGKSRSPSPM